MNVKEFLSQAYHIDQKIKSNLDKIRLLRELYSQAAATYSEAPNKHEIANPVEDAVVEIVNLENEIRSEMDKLIKAKLKIIKVITNLENDKQRRLLELRYLSFKKWTDIAKEIGYGIDNIFNIHRKALQVLSHKKVYS